MYLNSKVDLSNSLAELERLAGLISSGEEDTTLIAEAQFQILTNSLKEAKIKSKTNISSNAEAALRETIFITLVRNVALTANEITKSINKDGIATKLAFLNSILNSASATLDCPNLDEENQKKVTSAFEKCQPAFDILQQDSLENKRQHKLSECWRSVAQSLWLLGSICGLVGCITAFIGLPIGIPLILLGVILSGTAAIMALSEPPSQLSKLSFFKPEANGVNPICLLKEELSKFQLSLDSKYEQEAKEQPSKAL